MEPAPIAVTLVGGWKLPYPDPKTSESAGKDNPLRFNQVS